MKEIKVFSFELKDIGDDGSIEGYAAVFNNVDLVGDRIKPGAFKRTINSTKGKVPICWQHGEPIGMGTHMEEDEKGLFVKGKLLLDDDVPEGRKAYALARAKIVKSMSIGYKTMKYSFVADKDLGVTVRELQELKLFEYSLVTTPANPEADITRVKQAWSLEELEAAFVALSSEEKKTVLHRFNHVALADTPQPAAWQRETLDTLTQILKDVTGDKQ